MGLPNWDKIGNLGWGKKMNDPLLNLLDNVLGSSLMVLAMLVMCFGLLAMIYVLQVIVRIFV